MNAEVVGLTRLLILLSAAALGWYLLQPEDRVVLGPGVMAEDPPWQQNLDQTEYFMHGDHRVTLMADFGLRAKLLARESYYLGEEAEISPVDFALGWGPMSDEAVLQHIDISQSNRWYRWRASSESGIPLHDIKWHSSNMHIIPADDSVADRIDEVRVGQVVELSGHLVRVDRDDGWRWISSLTREDTGAGSCELFYVKQVQTIF